MPQDSEFKAEILGDHMQVTVKVCPYDNSVCFMRA